MTLVRTDLGLVLAEEALDEAAIGRALKRLDPNFALQKEADDVPGGWKYKVLLLDDDYRPLWQAWWADEFGRPLPLSSGIVDFVDRHRKDARNKDDDADTHNEKLLERIHKYGRDLDDDVIFDHKAKIERGRTSVSFGPLTRLSEMPRRERRRRP